MEIGFLFSATPSSLLTFLSLKVPSKPGITAETPTVGSDIMDNISFGLDPINKNVTCYAIDGKLIIEQSMRVAADTGRRAGKLF